MKKMLWCILILSSCTRDRMPEVMPDEQFIIRQIVAAEFGLNEDAGKYLSFSRPVDMTILKSEILVAPGIAVDPEKLMGHIRKEPGQEKCSITDLEFGGIKGAFVQISVNRIILRPVKGAPLFKKDDDFCTIDKPWYSYTDAALQLDSSLKYCQGGSPFPIYDVKVKEFRAADFSSNGLPVFSEPWFLDGLFHSKTAVSEGFAAAELEEQLTAVLNMRKKLAPVTTIVPPYRDHRGREILDHKWPGKMFPRAYMAGYTYHTATAGGITARWYELSQVYFRGERALWMTGKMED